MKLNTKRTVLVGFAFLSICAFWQMYDNLIPKILTETFHMGESVSGIIMAADNEFVLGMVKKPAIEQLIREKASALLGRPVAVRFALKNQVSNLGKDPMDALVQFGEQHSDIFTIK